MLSSISQIAGRASAWKPRIGRATTRPNCSALASANCLGTSSPKTTVRNVRPRTTSTRASV